MRKILRRRGRGLKSEEETEKNKAEPGKESGEDRGKLRRELRVPRRTREKTEKPGNWGDSCYLAGSRQQVQLDIGVCQAIEIHGLEALESGGWEEAVSTPSLQGWVLGVWRAQKKGLGWRRRGKGEQQPSEVPGVPTLALRMLQCSVQEAWS